MKKIFLLLLLTLTGSAAFAQIWPAESLTFTTRQPNGGGTMVRVVDDTTALGLYYDNGTRLVVMKINSASALSIKLPEALSDVADIAIDQNNHVYFCGRYGANSSYVAKTKVSEMYNPTETLEYMVFGIPELHSLVSCNTSVLIAISRSTLLEIDNFSSSSPCNTFSLSSETFDDVVVTENYVATVGISANGFVVRRAPNTQNTQNYLPINILAQATNGVVFSNPNDTYLDPASNTHAVALAGDNIAISHLAASNRAVPPLGVDAQTRLHWISLENNNVEVRGSQYLQDPSKCEARELAYIPGTQTVAVLRPTDLNAWNYHCDIVFFNPYRVASYNAPYFFSTTASSNYFSSIDADEQNTLVTGMVSQNGQAQWMLKDVSQQMGSPCYNSSSYAIQIITPPTASPLTVTGNVAGCSYTYGCQNPVVDTIQLTLICRNQ